MGRHLAAKVGIQLGDGLWLSRYRTMRHGLLWFLQPGTYGGLSVRSLQTEEL